MSSVVWEQLVATPALELPLTFVDVETTGLSPHYGDRVCEVAAVHYWRGREVERFASLVNPGRGITPAAAAVNGITAAMVRGAPRFADVAGDLRRLLAAGITVAHNAPFDLAFLAHELSFAGRPLPATPVVDTLALARRCFSFPSNSLGSVAAQLGIAGPGHRALSDVLTTRAVFERFVQMLDDPDRPVTLGALITLQGVVITWPHPRRDTAVPLPPELSEAVREGRPLRLSYLSAHGVLTERLVDPIQFVAREGRVYLVAYCHLRQEQRTFKIESIVRYERG